MNIVYAVDDNLVKHRISGKLPQASADKRWYRLDRAIRAKHKLNVSYPDGSTSRVRFFAIRAEDDPTWPVYAKLAKITRTPDALHSVLIRKAAPAIAPAGEPWACAIATDTGNIVEYGRDPIIANGRAHREARITGLI